MYLTKGSYLDHIKNSYKAIMKYIIQYKYQNCKHLTKEDVKIISKYKNTCSTLLIPREITIKILMRFPYAPSKIAKISKTGNTKSLPSCGAKGALMYSLSESSTGHTL